MQRVDLQKGLKKMPNTTLNTRIVLCGDATVNWGSSEKVLLKGEMAIEFTSGTPKIKIGDGVKKFSELPYATMTPEEILEKINTITGDSSHVHVNKEILDQITAAFTTELKSNYDTAYEHSQSEHAPVDAQENTIETIKVNGEVVSPEEKVVNITIPPTYTHPDSSVEPGTYKSVTVDAKGHVTAGTNPTTLAGYGITDAASKVHTHESADITSLDASKLTGVIDIDHLPKGALERCVVVEDDEARFALTTNEVQKGDTVKVTSTKNMYFVVDDTKLNEEDGYEVYTAGSATSVPWSGVTGKPSTFTPSTHTHQTSEISGLDDALAEKATSAQGAKADTAVQSVKISGNDTELKHGTSVTLPEYPTTLPASDVSAWAKAPTKPTYTKSEVGLENVTNDKQVKGLASGTTAGHVVTWGEDGYTVKDSGFTIASNVPANAKFTDTTYSTATTSTLGLVKSASGTNKVAVAGDGTMSVSAVSTDILSQGSNTLILNGGGAE